MKQEGLKGPRKKLTGSLCRIRYFSDGAVLGSRSFVDSFFECERSRFGDKRETGARKLHVSMGSVTSLRDLT